MNIQELIKSNESSKLEFKEDSVKNEHLAREIVAFANFKGGIILLGVADDHAVKGLTRSDNEERIMQICSSIVDPPIIPEYETKVIQGKEIAVIGIDTGKEKPYAVLKKGKRTYFIRAGSTSRESKQRELIRMTQDSAVMHYEIIPTAANYEKLDKNLIFNYFLNYRGINLKDFQENELKQVLINSCIMNEREELTVLGCLLFTIEPLPYYAGAGITFAVINGNRASDPLVEIMHFDSDMFSNFDSAFKIFKIYNQGKIAGLSENGQRLKVSPYPERSVREILINAIIHRDYSIEGTPIKFFLYKDFLEIQSPGLIPNLLTVDKMKMGMTYYRNPVIMGYFYDKGMIERMGRGIRIVFEEMYKHNGSEPEITEEGELSVVVRLKRKQIGII